MSEDIKGVFVRLPFSDERREVFITEMDCGDAIEAHGWDYMSKEFDMFLSGARAAQNEIAEELER